MDRKKVFTIPNILCIFRILLVPVFVVLYLRATDWEGYIVAASVIFLASLTDFLDGFIARRYNMISDVGKIIDPLADKLMQCGIAVSLMFKVEYMYVLFTIFVIKEITMFAFQAYLYQNGKKLNGALWYGKVATAVFYLSMILMIFLVPLEKPWVLNLLMLVVGGFLIMAFVLYMSVFVKMYHELKRERRMGIFESKYCRVEYREDGNAVLLAWKDPCSGEDYRAPVRRALEMLAEHRGCAFVVDARQGFEDEKSDAEWCSAEFLPKLPETGCREVVFIQNAVSGIEEEMNMWTERFSEHCRVRHVETYDAAVALLNGREAEQSDK